MIGGRRRPDSRPSRRRCRLASSRVEPLTARTSDTSADGGPRGADVDDRVRRVVGRRLGAVAAGAAAAPAPTPTAAAVPSSPSSPLAAPASPAIGGLARPGLGWPPSAWAAASAPSSPPRALPWPRPPRRRRRAAGLAARPRARRWPASWPSSAESAARPRARAGPRPAPCGGRPRPSAGRAELDVRGLEDHHRRLERGRRDRRPGRGRSSAAGCGRNDQVSAERRAAGRSPASPAENAGRAAPENAGPDCRRRGRRRRGRGGGSLSC